ncbi:MAG: dynamin family protein [Pseudomonadota bacterium]
MSTSMIDATFEQFRSEAVTWLKDLQGLIREIQNQRLEEIVSDMRIHAGEPFLFVVVGEIKAGKSSFINALVGESICAVDPAPCTDMVQEIVYASEKTDTRISPHLRRIGLPVDILRQVAIVDTPGTNTIIRHHHEITERFIPNSGLVLFVFPAKNPHTLSAWELLDMVKDEWRKRVVFILQQADLATEDELRVNRQKVAEYARARGIDAPVVFTTSARLEMAGDPGSGFEDIRRFIRETVTGGRHYSLKLMALLDSGEQVLKQVYDALQEIRRVLDSDHGLAERLRRLLDQAETDLQKDIRFLLDRLLDQYDRIGIQIKREFEAGLSVGALYKRAFSGTFSRRQSVQGWLEGLQKQFQDRVGVALEDVIQEGARHFTENLKQLADELAQALKTGDSPPQAAVVPAIGADRDDMVRDIREKVRELVGTEFAAQVLQAKPENMPSQLMSGSALTLVGAILLSTTHVAFLDITGGILTGLGIFMAGGVLMAKKAKIIREFNRSLLDGRDRFEEQLIGRLKTKFGLVQEGVRRRVSPFFESIEKRESQLAPLMADGQSLQQRLEDLRGRMAEYAF